jgi:acetylornithine deacetylase/succinyl-diaminopimelate desuccinylase-like protein
MHAGSFPLMTDVRTFVHDHSSELASDLDEWLRIPGISAQPDHDEDVRRSAQWLAQAFTRTGFPVVEIWETPGLPAVFAQWPSGDAGAPTVLVYGHHDVQPVDPLELWTHPPFEPTLDGDTLRARGASDDKGQLLFHLLAVRAHLAATGRTNPAVNLGFLIEGEEESGSPNFGALLRERRDRLDADVVVITDTGMVAPGVPSVCTGMRGLVACQVDFVGPALDLHSGVFGGAVPNPATALAEMIAALHDSDGRVQIAGFYDDVRALTDKERDLFARVPFDDNAMLAAAQSTALYGEAGFSTLERIGARPTAEVNGMWGGYTGPGGKTIIPSHAHAHLSFRLVADQECDVVSAAVTEFIAAHTPAGITSTVQWKSAGVAPLVVDIDTPAYEALSRAISTAFDGLPVLPTREGGSGPEAEIAAVIGAPMVFLGVGLPDDQIHAPNEKVSMTMLHKGAEAAAYLWSELAAIAPALTGSSPS